MSSIDQLKSLATSKLGFARTNQFLVNLPTEFSGGGFLSQLTSVLTGGTLGGGDLNLLCSQAVLPGKQILTSDRRIGMEFQKIAYGYAVQDVSLTFYALNDYGIRKYFDSWKSRIIDEATHKPAYKAEYVSPVKIHQLRKPIFNLGVDIGPIDLNLGIGGSTIYSVELIDAFPTTINAVELNNELDGLVQVSVELSYTNWTTRTGGPLGIVQAFGGLNSIFS